MQLPFWFSHNGDEKKIFPIRYKIILPYLVLIAIFAVVVSLLLSNIVFDSLEERYINQLIEVSKLSSESMVQQEDQLLSSLRLIANSEGVANALDADDMELLRDLTFGIVVENQIEDVEFLNADGQHLLSMVHKKNANLESYHFASYSDVNLNEWTVVEKVIQQENDGIGNKFSGYLLHNQEHVFFVSGPIYNDTGELSGVLLVGKTLDSITKQIRETTLAQITLYNHQGEVLSSTFSDPVSLTTEISQDALENQDAFSILISEKNDREISTSGIDYDELLGPWEIRNDTDIGILGAALAKSFIVTLSNSSIAQTVFIIVITLLLVSVIGAIISSRITRPLPELVRASQEISEGNLSVLVDSGTNDELKILADHFNQMAESLSLSKQELMQAYDDTLFGWAKALEMRDNETKGHTSRVTEMAVKFAAELGIGGEELVLIKRGALLHDIGKIGIPDAILRKPGPLNPEERKIIETHPQLGYDMIWNIEFLHSAIDIPYSHHENWDGTGYPNKLKGEEIPLSARIFALIDVWDALTSDRVYRKAVTPAEAVVIMESYRDTKFEARLLDIFLELIKAEIPTAFEVLSETN